MFKLHFSRVIEIRGVNPYVLITADQAQQLAKEWRRPMPAVVRVNGKPSVPWHINMMPSGDGSFYLYLHGDVRKASGTKVGDVVTIDVEFDAEYQNGPMHPVPDWFAHELNVNKNAKENWKNLAPSRQKEVLRYFSRLKSNIARERNLKGVMLVLSGETGHFMGRDWKNGK